VRDYADGAKTKRFPGVRVVSHPERLRYRGFDDVKLRVYSWVTDPDAVPAGATLTEDLVVKIEGVDVHKSARVIALDPGYQRRPLELQGAVPLASFDGRDTLIRLPASPLRAAKKGEAGLSPSARLYGWEYIPSPAEEAADVSTD